MWSEVVEMFDPYNNILGSEQETKHETKTEIKNLFRSWMIFIILIDLFLIAMGITVFCKMKGICPEYQRWATLFACIVPAAWNSRYAIRNYKGEV